MDHEHDVSRNGGKPKGQYANYFQIGHNAFEFVIDFGQFYQENHEPRFHTRIITTPDYAKALLEALRDSITRHEQTFMP